MLAKRKIPVDLDPGELQSIKSYQIEKDQEQKASEETSEPPKKKAKVLIKEEEEKEKEKSEEKSEEKGETTEGTYTTLATLDYLIDTLCICFFPKKNPVLRNLIRYSKFNIFLKNPACTSSIGISVTNTL